MTEKLTYRKSILFVAPRFYNFENNLKEEMEHQNYNVDLISYSYGSHRLPWKKEKLRRKIAAESSSVIQLININHYDILFVIKGELLDKEIINSFKNKNPSAITIIYLWDSLDNVPFDIDYVNCFDFKYSFDQVECNNYRNHNLQHKPLFYTNDFEMSNNSQLKYDFSMVGGMQDKRIKVLKQFVKLLPEYKYKIRLRTEITLNIPFNIIKFGICTYFNYALYKNLDRKAVAALLNASKAILDFTGSRQSGLSIRTIETLAAGRKLITTNPEVKKYDFYNANNIYVLEDLEPKKIKEFMERKFEPVNKNTIIKYSIENFVSTILKNIHVEYLNV